MLKKLLIRLGGNLVINIFGFSKDFIRCIQVLHSSPTARVKVNGSLSNSITLQRGCRQGCPASPSLFNLFIEPLAQAIRQEDGLKGISNGWTKRHIHWICLLVHLPAGSYFFFF